MFITFLSIEVNIVSCHNTLNYIEILDSRLVQQPQKSYAPTAYIFLAKGGTTYPAEH